MRGPERGFAILIVLWTLLPLTLLLTQLTSSGRGETRIAANLRAAAQVDAAAAGAIYRGLYHLLDASSDHWAADGMPHDVRVPGGMARITITDEAGLINPNLASAALLSALLHVLGADGGTSSRIALAIVGWRSADPRSAIGPDDYRRAGLAYVPPQSPFQSVDEVAAVLGMTPSLMATLRPHLSVYNAEPVDPALADPQIRQALIEQGAGPPPRADSERFPRSVLIVASVKMAVGEAVRRAEFGLGPSGGDRPFALLTWQEPPPP